MTFSWNDPFLTNGPDPLVEAAKTNVAGVAAPTVAVPKRVHVEVRKGGFAPFRAEWNTCADYLCILSALLLFNGRVADAMTGLGIDGATLNWRYAGPAGSEVVETQPCSDDGSFFIYMPADRYWKLEATAPGYQPGSLYRAMIASQQHADSYRLEVLLSPRSKRVLRLDRVLEPIDRRFEVSTLLIGPRTDVPFSTLVSSTVDLVISQLPRLPQQRSLYVWNGQRGPCVLLDPSKLLDRVSLPKDSTVLRVPDTLSFPEPLTQEVVLEDALGRIETPVSASLSFAVRSLETVGTVTELLEQQDVSREQPETYELTDHFSVRGGTVTVSMSSAFREAQLLLRSPLHEPAEVTLPPPQTRSQRTVVRLKRIEGLTTIHIVDHETGKGIKGASLSMTYWDAGWSQYHCGSEISVDDTGTARMAIAAGPKLCRVEAPRYAPLTFKIESQTTMPADPELAIRMVRGGWLSGVLTDHEGTPIPGVPVDAIHLAANDAGELVPSQFGDALRYPGEARYNGEWTSSWFVRGFGGYPSLTNADGSFRIEGLPPTGYATPAPMIPNFYRETDPVVQVPVGTDDIVLRVYRLWPVVVKMPKAFREGHVQSARISADALSWSLPRTPGDPDTFSVKGQVAEWCGYFPEGDYLFALSLDEDPSWHKEWPATIQGNLTVLDPGE